MVEVERRVAPAHEPALNELVPALLAVVLRMGLGKDGNLLALSHVSDTDRAFVFVLTLALFVALRPIHVAHDRRLPEKGSDQRAVVRRGFELVRGRPGRVSTV